MKLEALVVSKVEELLSEKALSQRHFEKARELMKCSKEKKSWKEQKQQFISTLDNSRLLAERLGQLPKTVSVTPIFKQMEVVENHKNEAQKRERK